MIECDNTMTFEELKKEAAEVRRTLIEIIYEAGSGHCGGSLSCVEILITLYRRILKTEPKNPKHLERDRFVLSKGHAAPALYTVLAKCGFFPSSELSTLRKTNSFLQGHPDSLKIPGVEISSGSLGMGISAGVGMAWSAKLKEQNWQTFVLVGDGELDEGQNWEALMLAHKLKLDNLTVLVDRNHVQLDGTTEDIMPLGSLKKKFEAFDWFATECDGHDCEKIDEAINSCREANKPAVIIAKTVKGKGIDFMEGDHNWHGQVLSKDNFQKAIKLLETQV